MGFCQQCSFISNNPSPQQLQEIKASGQAPINGCPLKTNKPHVHTFKFLCLLFCSFLYASQAPSADSTAMLGLEGNCLIQTNHSVETAADLQSLSTLTLVIALCNAVIRPICCVLHISFLPLVLSSNSIICSRLKIPKHGVEDIIDKILRCCSMMSYFN